MERVRQTKIVVTLGPATDGTGELGRLISAGMNCARINCSYGSPEIWQRRVGAVRAAAADVGQLIPVMFDLQGTKVRLAGGTDEQTLAIGTQVRLVDPGPDDSSDGSLPYDLCVALDEFSTTVTVGSEVVIGDGTPRLVVEQVTGQCAVARVTQPGRVGPGKGVTVIHGQSGPVGMTPKDLADLDHAVELGADFIAVSYATSAADMREVSDRIRALGSHARTIAKIEQIEAYENLDDILAAADGMMVARGDLGLAVGIERLPLIQKDMIRRGTQAGKLVITATQMLESMISSPQPTRAEAADVANAVIDGTSAVMLSAETSTGSYPVEAVSKMAEIAFAAEAEPVRGAIGDSAHEPDDAAVMHAALYTAAVTGAVAIVVPTSTGNTARACAKYRPQVPVIALSENVGVARQLNLEWGVQSGVINHATSTDELIAMLLEAAKRTADLPTGSRVVVTAGQNIGQSGATDLIALREI